MLNVTKGALMSMNASQAAYVLPVLTDLVN